MTALRTPWLIMALGIVSFHCVAPEAARAQTVEQFYKGKQIRLIVGSGAGGGYDVYARAFAPFFGKHIPGQPQVVVENMPGASSLMSTDYMATAAPRDGTVLALPLSSVPTAPLLTPSGAKFDPTKFAWIGSITRDSFVGYVWHTTPVQTIYDLKTTQVVMGADSLGSAGADMAIIARDFFGLKIKLVLGYHDSVAVKEAMEKGEVQGTFANQYADLVATRPYWLKDHLVRIIVQDGFEKLPSLPKVPLLISLAKTQADRQALDLLLRREDFAKPIFAPPGVPPDRIAALRAAFKATVRDPAFLAATKKAHLPIDDPMPGEQLQAVVSQLEATPASVVNRVLADFAKFK